FDSWKQFWRNMTSLSWRCLTTALSLSLLILGLRIFSRMGELSHKEQRGFNAITILLGSFASLGLGSVLGYLGSMLRWRLLARKKYKVQDIELLLAMSSPNGSAVLLFTHVGEWRLSLTTFIVMLYLLVNISGKFSVAIFGLTYNLVDDLVEVSPTLITDWSSSVLLARNATDFQVVEKTTLGGRRHTRDGIRVPQDLTAWLFTSLWVDYSYPTESGGNVVFVYHIPEFIEGKRSPTLGHTVHSSANCTMFRLEGHKYWKDYETGDETSEGWDDETNRQIAEVLRALESKNAWPQQGAEQAIWAAPLVGGSNVSSLTYILYHGTAWECTSRLFETLKGSHYPKPLFGSSTLFLLPIAERAERAPEPASRLSNSCGGPSGGRTPSIVYRSFSDLKSQSSPSVGVQNLNFYQNGTGGSTTQKNYYNLYIAGLVARLPIAAIAYGNEVFPRVEKVPDARWTEYVETKLEVKWGRVGIAAGTIVAVQILAITTILYYCRNVHVREDSYLTTAELLKTVLNRIEDGNTMTAKELEDASDEALEGPISYGTIPGPQKDQLRVALGCGVDDNFPGFP
ncbi:hypothetical protein B9Z19DRAFT_888929, partial [Tuber borchii]